MTRSEFERSARGAKMLQEMSTDDPHASDFYAGYQRGLRRHYHGESFGSADEHARWMAASDERRDELRRYIGLGYRAGFDGMNIADAIKNLAKFTAASAAGSARSEAKAQAARENARRPRPGAQGKPKPRKQ